ncbi:unnamed protein product [marine sediment metagenome]|uniref:Uncharacterized protein n=1 Tax=marine sediment metagenome TaxID=412755 RepID=X0VHX4_9ZZZZ
MSKSTIDLSGFDLDSLTVDNFRTVTGHRLRKFKEFASQVKDGTITDVRARELTLEAIIAKARGGSTTGQVAVSGGTTGDVGGSVVEPAVTAE